jgi:hypothetical protein
MDLMMSRVSRAAGALVAVSAVLCACSGGEVRARGATVTYDTVGDTIVARAEGPAAWGDSVSVQEEVRIGELEGADEYTFGNVVSLTVDSAGVMYVLDQQALTVRKYDVNGRHLQNIGRSGSGPGELKRPHSLDFMPDGRLAVRDFGNARINLYDIAGESVGTVVIPGGLSTSTPMHIDTAGRISTSVITQRGDSSAKTGQRAMFQLGYQRYDAHGRIQDTIRTPHPTFEHATMIATSPDGSGRSATNVPFTPVVHWTLDRAANVVWGINDTYTIRTLRAGKPFFIARTIEPVPVQAGEKGTEEERITRNMKQTQPGWSWNGPRIPDVKPFFRGITVAADDRIWVQLSQPAVREPADTTGARAPDGPPPLDRWIEPAVYDVFEPDGQWLARVALPPRFRMMYMSGDYMWGVQRDELDVNYVVRLRIVH